ncbi:MAG: histidinol-phosphatase HisJ [Firmicutes bacterium]|nr:histidinol-phosphatase HisJ [Bacillota bacterium]MDD4264093.1 histidinol-phosphatase HisJ [Bacillota bacterium]MDD4694627.1 histidinol-phosphatase HisJ [Bacillota bacterium]
MTFLVDYHMHTKRCNHADGTMAEYVDQALKIGLTEIGFSDHLPLSAAPDDVLARDWAMQEEELTEYVNDIHVLQKRYPNISIKVGIEADYFCDQKSNQKTRDLLDRVKWDYVIGSVHHLGTWVIDSSENLDEFEKRDLFKVYENYFETVIKAANSGLYDVLGHIDVIKKYGYVPKENLSSLYKDVAKEIKKSGIAFEINTSGLRKPIGQIYPAPLLLKELLSLEVPVTLGSDSHSPLEVGKDFDVVVKLLKDFGTKEIAIFNKRQKIMKPLE